MMKMITQTNGLNFFSQLTRQIGLCCSLLLFLTASAFGQTCYTLTATGGSYPSEVSWNLLNENGVITSGTTAADEELCLEDACYTLEMIDSYGDGWNGAAWSLSINGQVAIGPFTFSSGGYGTAEFSLGGVVCAILGCTDENSLNFNPEATEDDGSCEYPTLIDCSQEFSETYCYTDNENTSWVYEVVEGETINLDFILGNIEYSWDYITIYDGFSTSDPVLYASAGSDLTVVNVNSSSNTIRMDLYSDGSVSCASSATYGGGWEWEVSCGVSYDCDQLELNIGQACDDLIAGTYDDIVTENCECAGTPYDCQELLMDIGMPCDDQNETTILDVINADCECIGQLPPANNECVDSFLLVCGVTTNGSTALASPAPEGLAFCGAGSTTAPGVWYSYFAMDSNPTIIDLAGSTFDTKLFVYTGLCGELECVAGNDDFNGVQSQVSFESVAGTYYSVFVTGYGTNSGDYNISINCGYDCDLINDGAYFGDACDDLDEGTENDIVTENCECIGTEIPPAPENDLICDAAAIICGETAFGTTINATADQAPFCGTSNSAPGVWYVLDVDFAGSITASLCDLAEYDSKLSIFSADACDGELVCLGGNDDACGAQSEVSADVAPGTYYILVHGYSYNTGDFGLEVSCVEGVDCPALGLNIGAPCSDDDDSTINDTVNENCECVGSPIPDNDACADAIPVECGTVISGTTINANPEVQEYCETSDGTGGAVWYSYASDNNALVTLSLCEADFDSKMRVYSGSCDELICVFGDDDNYADGCGNDPLFDFTAEAGVNYFILVHGYGANEGNFDLTVNCTPIFDCPQAEANIGDACDDGDAGTENDILGEDCGCAGTPIAVSECEDWVIYLNNNAGGVTDIYSVDISSGNAEMAYITTVNYQGHIAYNSDNNLIYVLHNGNGSYVTVNPHTVVPEVSAPVFLSQDIPSITTAAFAPNGKLLVGTMTEDIIYSINVADQVVSLFDSYAPLNGGDIAFDSTGMLYLATRTGNGLYQVYPDDVMADQLIGTLPSLVTGIALTDGEQLLTSHKNNSALLLRNLDGSDAGVSYPLMLDGAAYNPADGDLASGCNTYSGSNEGDCNAFSTFYASHGPGISGTNLYRVEFSGANANMTLLTNVTFQAHIAYNAQDDIVYLVEANGSFVRAFDPTAGVFLGDIPIVGGINSLYAVAYDDNNGVLYLGDANDDEIYSLDLGTGVATYYADAPVDGGDLAFQNGDMILATRAGDKIYSVVEGSAAVLIGSIPADVNGMAHANNATGLVMANTAATVFTEVDATDGSIITAYTAILDGEVFTMVNGDMASGCSDDEPLIITGECNATELFEYVEGTTVGGGVLPAARSNSDQALGAPERTDAMVFTTLGYGGSITVGFNGAVINGAGDDIEVVETSFGNPGCDSYPEFANVSVSMDGISWFSAGTVCKGEPFVDISDAGDFDYVMFVRVSNIDFLTTSSDGFDVDGIVALHNCEEGTGVVENNNIAVQDAGLSTMSSFPNPTNGPSQVVFVTAVTGRTMVEVYDMNGRNVATLFNQVAQAGLENRVDFNGASLPNGVYIYKLTTNNETIIDKFMIAR